MNIEIQLCGLLILILLYIFYKSHKTLQLYTEKIFFRTLCIIIVSLSLDILSLVTIYFRQYLPNLLVLFVCKSYIVSLIWGSCSAFIYVLTDITTEINHRKWTKRILLTPFIETLIIFALPIYIFDEGTQVYTYGPAVICVYVFVLLHIASTIISIFKYKRRLNPRRKFAVGLWMLIWVLSALIQFINNNLLIVGFASALGMLILFVIMENPEAYLDRRLGYFNSYALTEYLKKAIEKSQKISVLEIAFTNTNSSDEHGLNSDDIMKKILHFLKRYPKLFVFKNIHSGLLILSKNEEFLCQVGEEIITTFSYSKIFQKEAMIVYIKEIASFPNPDELFHFLSFLHADYSSEKGRLFLADNTIIARYNEQHVIEQEITSALLEDRVEVFLQPIFSNEENSFTSAEALVRIRKEDGSLLSPGLFIPVAEENGQILELGERIFEKVCNFLQNTEAVNLGIHYIEVNLSVVQCEKEDLAERLISIIKKYNVKPEMINLEITETASINARNILLNNMKKLIEYGFTFSLDDFGKGESNLMYVVEMPVSIVKLDYDMSKAFFQSEKAKHVVRAVIQMAHSMGLKLVAEGIETQEEIDSMHRENMDYIQGYYYSKPLPMDEFLRFISK